METAKAMESAHAGEAMKSGEAIRASGLLEQIIRLECLGRPLLLSLFGFRA